MKNPLRILIKLSPDNDPDTSYLEGEAKRKFAAGLLEYVGVTAIAKFSVGGLQHEIQSGGLWGVEYWTDSAASTKATREYIKQVAKDEAEQLIPELRKIGFSKAEIQKAFLNAEEI